LRAWSLLLLAATVRSFAHMLLGISDRNKMMLWPGCEGHAEFSLHIKNVRSVRFVVKRRGCCCNRSCGVALIVWFTTNRMCVHTIIYVARASNRKRDCEHDLYCCLLPQCEALRTCCSGFSERSVWSLLLLAARVWSFAHLLLRLSACNKMVLWPGCECCARCSLHKKNVWSVGFIVKRRGCCCNLSVGVALNVWFNTNGMWAKNNTTYMWREKAIIEWSWRVISIVACCHSVKLCTLAAQDFWSQQYFTMAYGCFELQGNHSVWSLYMKRIVDLTSQVNVEKTQNQWISA